MSYDDMDCDIYYRDENGRHHHETFTFPVHVKYSDQLRDAITRRCATLSKLSLQTYHRAFTTTKQLVEALKTCTALQIFEIDCTFWKGESALNLAAALKHCPNLTTLKMHCSNSEHVACFLEGLPRLENLETLDLSGNDLSDYDGSYEAADQLVEYIRKKKCPLLKALYVNNCGLRRRVLSLINVLPNCRYLHTLSIERNLVPSTAFLSALADQAPLMPRMTCFKMGGNNCVASMAAPTASANANLVKICNNWPDLEELSIGGCFFSAEAIVNVVGNCRQLRTLIAYQNNMRDVGATNVVKTLIKFCPRINEVNLENNAVSGDVARRLGAALAQSTNVAVLRIADDPLDVDYISTELQRCKDIRARERALLAGSYRIYGPENCPPSELMEKITKEYLGLNPIYRPKADRLAVPAAAAAAPAPNPTYAERRGDEPEAKRWRMTGRTGSLATAMEQLTVSDVSNKPKGFVEHFL